MEIQLEMNKNSSEIGKNSITYSNELVWLNELIEARFKQHFSNEFIEKNSFIPPDLTHDESKYANWVKKLALNNFERLVVISSLAYEYSSNVFDKFLIKNKGLDKRFTEFGGKLDDKNSRFIPTLETLVFLYYGNEVGSKFQAQRLFNENHVFNRNGVISLSLKTENDSVLSRILSLSEEIIQLLTLGVEYKPDYSTEFPAKLIETEMNWEDLVLNPVILDEIQNINTWLLHKDEINQSKVLSKKLNKGYKCLFYGPPGTGKTLSTLLIGKKNKKDVYRIDLSQIVSKYVGETEKNLAKIFNIAENKDWVLFFDEAESLFSKRTAVNDSKDKFANQQTAYLLQRLEEYKGLIILATNLKPNIDSAFSRRIQSTINFSMPDLRERKILWTNFLNQMATVEKDTIDRLSKDFKLSGGSIKNVIQFSWLLAKRNGTEISEKILLQGIRRELNKDGKSIDSI